MSTLRLCAAAQLLLVASCARLKGVDDASLASEPAPANAVDAALRDASAPPSTVSDAAQPARDAAIRDAGTSLPSVPDATTSAPDAAVRCGDGACTAASESCADCPEDCGPCAAGYCGDGACNAAEDCSGCPVDCGPCAGGANCGPCSLLTYGRTSDCVGDTLYRCHDGSCLIGLACGSRTCVRPGADAYCM